LAAQLGPSPQLEIGAKSLGMTWRDEQQAIAYKRAALNCRLDQTLHRFIERLTAVARTEGWTRKRIKIVEFAAGKACRPFES
jgi:hypothetical protein